MATIVLQTAGAAAGAAVGGPIGAVIGSQIGRFVGGQIDNAIFGPTKLAAREGARLENLAVQTSTYGKMLPILYGTVRIAGNIIWARPIKETRVTTTVSSGGKGSGSEVEQDQINYTYSVTLAIALCEGVIDEVVRVWADAKQLNLSQGTYRLYKGDETQTPDTLIESFEGVGKTPAYRGTAYVVIEDFLLADYGNRIPNFTFEVKRKALDSDNGDILENMITAMVMIPGSGEFVYDTITQTKVPGYEISGTWVQQGNKTHINQNNGSGKADALVALDQLIATCPNLEWIALVVTWFGNDLDAGACVIKAGVEYQTGAKTEPDTWSSSSFTRATAHPITLDEDDRPVYGGTPSDACVLRYLQAIRARGLKAMVYPMFFMDTPNKPWRGRVTGSATDVANFFTKTNGYNAFISHYANLTKNDCDAFVIGSELIGLTKVYTGTTTRSYPAVSALVSLAASVKTTVGSGVKVIYAADWSEYHHTDDGWYNMDPLWASSNIDVVGIDAYFPLSNAPQNGYATQDVIDGWTSGEGYDFYYTDPARTTTAPLGAPYAWKNIDWWWKHTHTNPNGVTTAWVPESKKIWFTEYGFPSVDGAINQPNVFYDPNSSESYFPRFSRGRVDFRAQRQGLLGTEKQWAGSNMVENKFIWTWDARPYPYYPDLLNVWGDGNLWKTGHWVTGKLGLSGLSAIVRDICLRAGLDTDVIDTTKLTELVDGYALVDQITARKAIENLQAAFYFDAVESDDVLKFIPRGNDTALTVLQENIVPQDGKALAIVRKQELELPREVDVLYLNRLTDYQTGAQRALRATGDTDDIETLSLPIVMGDQQAKNVADIRLYTRWLERTQYQLSVPLQYAQLEPTDVIELSGHTLRIIAVDYSGAGVLRLKAVAEEIATYDVYSVPAIAQTTTNPLATNGLTQLQILDIPALPSDDPNAANLRFVASGEMAGWQGGVLYRSDDGGSNYTLLGSLDAGVIGVATSVLGSGATHIKDEVNSVTVSLIDGELNSISEIALLNGGNAALLGEEIIQFQTAELLSPNSYRLSNLLRGRLGTEHTINTHSITERFVFLGEGLFASTAPLGLSRKYKPVSIGSTLNATPANDFTFTAQCLKPYAPVHIAGSRDGSGNISITWVRRTRVNGGWLDNTDIPLNEQSELYDVEILNGANVVRTFSNIPTSATSYSAIDQTADFGSLQASVSIKIYQLSARVGRGVAAQVTV